MRSWTAPPDPADLVVKARETSFLLGNQDRLETTVPVAGNLDADRTVLGQYCLGTLAIALVGDRGGLGCAG